MDKEFLNNYDEKVIALAQYLDINLEPDFNAEDYTEEKIEQAKQDAIKEVTDELDSIVEVYENYFNYYNESYTVVTDEEEPLYV